MNTFTKVAILGSGAFGVALAKLSASKSNEVFLWARDENTCLAINQHRHHPTRLSQFRLPENILALTDLKEALLGADVVISALPMEALSVVMNKARNYFSKNALLVSTSKGIEEGSLNLASDCIKQALPFEIAHRACYLSGPSFAVELAMDLPTALTVASFDQEAALWFQDRFSQKNLRLYRTSDVISVLVGGAFKNVIAIAAGACAHLGLGRNALAALITRGLSEITRISRKMGGRPETLSGLAGAGDLILSCTDDLSRNHRLGGLLADGLKLADALNRIGSVVEGVKTAKSIPSLIKLYDIELPIAESVFRVLYQGEEVKAAIGTLLSRKLKEETF